MLEKIMNSYAIFFAIGVIGGIGIISKLVMGLVLRRMVKASANMGKSTHRLMKLVRAKFEHACMLSDKVENIGAFVEKYLYEYRVLGLRLHTWRQIEKQMVWLCGILGAAGAAGSYELYGIGEEVFQYGIFGTVGMILLFLLYISGDMSYHLDAVQVYMIDYLENVYAPRYAKMNGTKKREENKPIQVTVQQAEPVKEEEKTEEMLKQAQKEEASEEAFVVVEEEETETAKASKDEPEREERKEVRQEVILREILEEFLA